MGMVNHLQSCYSLSDNEIKLKKQKSRGIELPEEEDEFYSGIQEASWLTKNSVVGIGSRRW